MVPKLQKQMNIRQSMKSMEQMSFWNPHPLQQPISHIVRELDTKMIYLIMYTWAKDPNKVSKFKSAIWTEKQ